MSLWDKNKKVIMEVLEAVFLGPFIVCYNNIKQVMKSLFKGLMLLVVVITVTSCSGSSDGDLMVTDGNHNYYTNSVTLEDNSAKFTDTDNNQVIINGNFTISDNKCSLCEEEK
tara:strand:+ start:603 stop:941 length:339 start_codon:yes stop_codon:yes gene_type:complete